MAQTKIAAVVLQYGRWQRTIECIASLLRSSLRPEWIIIVDNASPDDSCRLLETGLKNLTNCPPTILNSGARAGQVNILKMTSNGGYASGNNAGITIALELGAEAVLIINNDATLDIDALKYMKDALFAAQKPGLCGPLIVYPRPGSPVQCMAGGKTNYFTGLSTFIGERLTLDQACLIPSKNVESQLNFICGACVLASAVFIKDIGLMDEGFFLYCEEEDWAIRARGKYDLTYAEKAICWHYEGSSTGFGRHSFRWKPSLRILKSRLRLAWLHHPHYVPSVAIGCLYAGIRLICKQFVISIKNMIQNSSK